MCIEIIEVMTAELEELGKSIFVNEAHGISMELSRSQRSLRLLHVTSEAETASARFLRCGICLKAFADSRIHNYMSRLV